MHTVCAFPPPILPLSVSELSSLFVSMYLFIYILFAPQACCTWSFSGHYEWATTIVIIFCTTTTIVISLPPSVAAAAMAAALLLSDNYASKFKGSELAWEIYFLSSRGSPRIFKGSHQMPWIWTLSEGKSQNFLKPAMLIGVCHMIRLFYTSPLKERSSNQNIAGSVFCNLHDFSMYIFDV